MTDRKGLIFGIQRFFAINAFRRREYGRDKRRFPTRWLSHFQLVHLDVVLAHEADPDQINEALLERMVKGRDDAQKALQARAVISSGITAFLLLTILKVDLPLAVAGVQLRAAPGVVEILIIVNAALWCAAVSRQLTAQTMTTAIKAALLRIYPPETTYLHHAALHTWEPPVLFPHPMNPQLTWKRPTFLAALSTLLMLIGLIISILVIAAATRLIFYLHVWSNPSIDPFVAHAAVALSLTLDAFALIYLLIFILPLPYRDNGLLTTLDIAKQTNPATLQRLYEEHYYQGYRDRQVMEEKGFIKPKSE